MLRHVLGIQIDMIVRRQRNTACCVCLYSPSAIVKKDKEIRLTTSIIVLIYRAAIHPHMLLDVLAIQDGGGNC